MTATSILKKWGHRPNSDLTKVIICAANTVNSGDTLDVTLANYGINATGLLSVKAWRHTTDGSVIVTEAVTTAVVSGVLTITFVAGTADFRVIELVGRADVGAFV